VDIRLLCFITWSTPAKEEEEEEELNPFCFSYPFTRHHSTQTEALCGFSLRQLVFS